MEVRGGPGWPDGGQNDGQDNGQHAGYGVADGTGEMPQPSVRAWGTEPGSQMPASAGFAGQGFYPGGGGAYPPAPPRKAKRTVPLWATIVVGVVCLGVGAGVGGAKNTATSTAAGSPVAAGVPGVSVSASPSPVVTTVFVTKAEPAPAKPVTAAAPATTAAVVIPGDGTYIVGTDIKPGRYKTTGPAPGSEIPDCYWERDRDLDNGLNSILANDNSTGQMTVQIRSTDAAFKTTGCADWVKIG